MPAQHDVMCPAQEISQVPIRELGIKVIDLGRSERCRVAFFVDEAGYSNWSWTGLLFPPNAGQRADLAD